MTVETLRGREGIILYNCVYHNIDAHVHPLPGLQDGDLQRCSGPLFVMEIPTALMASSFILSLVSVGMRL